MPPKSKQDLTMDEQHTDGASRRAEKLIEKLRAVRRNTAGAPEGERLAALVKVIEENLDDVHEPELSRILENAQDSVSPRSHAATDTEVAGLRQQCESLHEKLGLAEQESEDLRREISAMQEPSANASDLETLEAIKDGLRRCVKGENVSPEDLGLPDSESRLFRLVKALLRFALDYEVGLNALLFQFSIGVSSKFDTQLQQGFQRIVKDRFAACLENEEGSLEKLKESLHRNHKFLIDLNLSYDSCLHEGTKQLLAELNPEPIIKKHKRFFGHDWAGAAKTVSQLHGDLSNLNREELWERFFYTPFREKLASYLDPD